MHNRHLKVQYTTVFFVFIVLSVFCVFASMAFHKILIGADRAPTYYPIKECIESIRTVKKHRLLFLCFEGLSFCLAASLMVSYSRNYISKLQCITPKIYTPVAAGQNQFGSARWMTEKEKAKAFDTAVINHKDEFYKALLEAGKKDRAIIKKHVIDKEDKQEHKKLHFQYIKWFVGKVLPEEKRHILREKLRLSYDEILKKYFPSIWQMKEQRNVDKLANLFECEFDVSKEADSNAEIKTDSIETITNTQCFSSGGVVIGMKKLGGGKELFYYIGDDTHLLGIGATRSGKSRTMVIQSICFLALAGESMIVSDLKGELNQYTGTFLKRLGYNVITLDFKNPLKSDRYNLLQPIIDAIDEDNIPKATECVWDLVGILVGDAKGEKIWNNGEASTIACAIMSVVYDNREGERRKYQTLTNVYYFIAEMCKPIGKNIPIVEYVKVLPDNHPAKPLVAISEIAPERTRGSFYTAALTTLKLFTSSYINAMTMASDYNPKDLGRKKTALFMVLPDERTTYYSIASLLVLQHYIQLVNESDGRGGRLKNRVNFILDEFGNFAAIPSFDTLLTVGGGRGMRFNLFLQDFAQLEIKYDEKVAKTIKGNCQVWDYLQTNSPETLKEISEKLGNYTVSTYSLSSQSSKYQTPSSSASVNLTGRALLMTNEIAQIDRPYSLVTSKENPAIMYSPDLSKWNFNTMLGLGNTKHNEKVRDYREKQRIERMTKKEAEKIELWSECWKYWQKQCGGMLEQPLQQIPIRRTIARRDEDYY
ncbi:VirD4-like conjugal transfer protein, CD1115 family [Clostridium sp. BNL1100]|uniref:VirD4-like conjugal transfer protein, CD1115 family n=1 Tax=Clostridium sp. BNL1100 TaxID=755731 RepID=UPI00024A76D0|nr:type IV secretory system conjugative DNA transfer family protein [Clostridium sp. BNL1100]AEY65611.1 type IV secretory pathway, VirD4 component [Clostridium sp. BNL1100]